MGVCLIFKRDDPGLCSVAPHPTLLITLAIAARYGFQAALQAAAICAAGHLLTLLLLLHRSVPGLYALLAPPYSTPLVVLGLCAVPFGMLVQRHIDTGRRFAADHAQLKAQRAQFEARLQELTDINIELAQRIVRAEVTVPALCEHARRLTTTDRGRLFHAALDLLADVLQVKAASIWLPTPAGPVRSHFRGAAEPIFPAPAVASWTEAGDVLLLCDTGLPQDPRAPYLIGRLREGEDGPVTAYLTVDEVPFRQSAQVRRLFVTVVAWISLAMGLSRGGVPAAAEAR